MSIPQKGIFPAPIVRRRLSKRRISNALTAAHNAGMAVRELKIGVNGEIDIRFGKPPDDEPEDLAKLL
jgi:hypothetical protein